MSILLSALTTSLLAAPVMDADVSRTLLRHYPQSAISKNKSAATLVEIWVDPSGKVYECKTLSFLGDEKLASETCPILLKMSANPAKSTDGRAAYGRIQTVLKFFTPDTEQGRAIDSVAEVPELVLTVNRLPAGSEDGLDVKLVGLVDTEGQVVECEFSDDVPADYGRAACGSLSTSQLAKGRDREGNPVSYVTSLSVRFTNADQAAQP